MTTSAPTVAVAAPVSTAANSSSNTSSTNSSSSSNSNNTNNNTSTNNTNNNNNSSSGTGGSVSTGGATGGGTSSSGSVSGTTAAIGMSNGLHAALPATQQQQLLHHHQQQQHQQNHLQQPQQQPNLQQPHLQQPHLLPQHLPQPLPLSIPHPATAPQQQQQQQQQQQTTRVMQSDEDFNIRFVNLVRTHKCLYDKKVPEYRNRDNQEKAWSLISQETRESVIHCKERWRNLRACLSRYIKQQSGSDPQHKPYYLTEHMAFLLPFLKSTRNSLDGNNCATLASLFQVHHHHHHQHQQQQQQHQQHQHQHHRNSQAMQMITQPHLHFNGEQLEMKHSLSDIEDEETIDAFDPAVAATVQQMNSRRSPMSDTASANTLQNFIPDVQLAELRTPDGSAAEITFVTAQHNGHISDSGRRLGDGAHEPKRIKTEPLDGAHHGLHPMYGADNTDMEFFRSILPDIAALTPQQKRKFKIGILELIDDVIDRFPAEGHNGMTSSAASRSSRRNSAREWRK